MIGQRLSAGDGSEGFGGGATGSATPKPKDKRWGQLAQMFASKVGDQTMQGYTPDPILLNQQAAAPDRNSMMIEALRKISEGYNAR